MPAATAIRHKRGGLYFEDFVVGECVEHRYTRTVTQMDNMLFSNMTLNPQPLHIDRHFCEQETEWGQPPDELAVHARPHDRHVGLGSHSWNDHRQSRHDGSQVSASAVRRRHGAREHEKSSASASRSHGREPVSSSFTTVPTIRTTSSWPNAGAKPSCACGRRQTDRSNHAFLPLRPRRQRPKTRESALKRRRRGYRRPSRTGSDQIARP